MRVSYREICDGARPWVALGNFINDFFGNFPARRAELVAEALTLPTNPTDEQYRWAAFCAASVQHLCEQYQMDCPAWVHNPDFILAEPWFHSPAAEKVPRIAQRYRQTTPEPFASRNIFCGNRVFNNKYEQAPSLQSSAA